MRRWSIAILFLFVTSSQAGSTCADPSAFVGSTISIARYFSEPETRITPGVFGIRGTGWFLSNRLIVTAAHVVEGMRLSGNDWKEIEIRERDRKGSVSVRIANVVGAHSEKIALIELRSPFAGSTNLPLRKEPLDPGERVATLAYPGGHLRFAIGRFVRHGDGDRFSGTALLEIYDGKDRLVIDHGASGAPVLDCEGRVVAIVSTAITQTIDLFNSSVRVSTAWHTPNVVAVPISPLWDLVRGQ